MTSRQRTNQDVQMRWWQLLAATFSKSLIRQGILAHALWLAALYVLTDGLSGSPLMWLSHFHQWDARWYASIALDGHGFMPQTYVFPPAHGWLLGRIVNVVQFIAPSLPIDTTFSIVAAANGLVCLIAGNILFVRLFAARFKIAPSRLWLATLVNPVAYFALSAYSDATFYALTLATIHLALQSSDRQDLWGLPAPRRWTRPLLALTLFVSPWVRLTGFSFASLAILKRREALATLASLAAFLIYYDFQTDRPLFFLSVQSVFGMPEGGFIHGAHYSLRVFFDGLQKWPDVSAAATTGPLIGEFFLHWFNFGLLPLMIIAISTASIIWLIKRREFLFALILASILIISHNQAFWRSTVRYMMLVYPIAQVAWMASTYGSRPMGRVVSAVIAASFLAMQVLYARIFLSGGWAF